jgi:hypothetical protein
MVYAVEEICEQFQIWVGGQCPPYDRMKFVRWAVPTPIDGVFELGIAAVLLTDLLTMVNPSGEFDTSPRNRSRLEKNPSVGEYAAR